MDELYYQVAVFLGTMLIVALRGHYGEEMATVNGHYETGKMKLHQFEKLLETSNEILEDDKVTPQELKRFVRQLQQLCS